MTNIKIRLARGGDIERLIEISKHPSSLGLGSIPRYLGAGRHEHDRLSSAGFEDLIVGLIHSSGGWYTCTVAEVEETGRIVGYCAWEWFEYGKEGERVVAKDRPVKLQKIWDELETKEPTEMPPRAYNPDAQPDELFLARSKACEFWGKHKEAHKTLRRISDFANCSEFWQIHHSAVDSAPEYRGVMEVLVRWGLELADEKALWTVVICPENTKAFYEKLGFEYMKTHVASVPGDDEVLELAWLRRRPQPK